jgi:hypothetical protein
MSNQNVYICVIPYDARATICDFISLNIVAFASLPDTSERKLSKDRNGQERGKNAKYL